VVGVTVAIIYLLPNVAALDDGEMHLEAVGPCYPHDCPVEGVTEYTFLSGGKPSHVRFAPFVENMPAYANKGSLLPVDVLVVGLLSIGSEAVEVFQRWFQSVPQYPICGSLPNIAAEDHNGMTAFEAKCLEYIK